MMNKHQQKLDPPGFWEEEFFGSDEDHLQSLYDQDEVIEQNSWLQESIDKTAAIKKQILTKQYETHTYKGYAVDGSFYNFWRRHHEAEQIKMSYLEFKKFNDHIDWSKGAQEGDEIHLPLGAQYIGMDDLLKLDATKDNYALYLDKAKNLILSNPHVGYISPQRLDSIDMRPDEKTWANKSDEVNPPSLKYLRYVVLLNDDFAFISQKTGLPEQVLKAGLEGPLQPGVSIRINPNQGNMILNFEKWAAQAQHSGALLSQMSLTQGHSNNFIHIIWMETYSFFARVYNNDSFETVTHQFITNAIKEHNKDKWIPPSNGNNPIGDNIDEKGFADVAVAWLDGKGSKHMYVYTYSSQLNRVEYKCTYDEYVQAQYDKDDEEKRKKEKKKKEEHKRTFNKNGTVSNLPGFFKILGNTIDELVPHDGSKAKLELELKIPSKVKAGLHTMFELENDGGKIKLHSRLGFIVEGEIPKIADVSFKAGGYIEAQGASGQHALQLYQFNFYHWLRMKASGLIHHSLLEEVIGYAIGGILWKGKLMKSKEKAGLALHMFLNAAFSEEKNPKKASEDFAGAEAWANKVKGVIKSGDYYVESGFYFKITASLELGKNIGALKKLSLEAEAETLLGNRIDKDSIGNAEDKRKKEGKSVVPTEKDYYQIGENIKTFAFKAKLGLNVPDPANPDKFLAGQDKGFIEAGIKFVTTGDFSLKELEIEIVPTVSMGWLMNKLKYFKDATGRQKWLRSTILTSVTAAVGRLSQESKYPQIGDGLNLIGATASQFKFDKVSQNLTNFYGLDGPALEIKNYLQLSMKYKYVPAQKKGDKTEHSVEFLVYDTLKFALDIEVIKLELEKANPISPKMGKTFKK
ncbi:hypothetical protein [uncultured Microscilla sp.]|uniref:hypothetical protein n=1 Tax=uncultured Microscilla sp. TaxID=432653 RepID=UPI0026296EF5|nr:hypothetical protein [uncultured Microscilla sp.]